MSHGLSPYTIFGMIVLVYGFWWFLIGVLHYSQILNLSWYSQLNGCMLNLQYTIHSPGVEYVFCSNEKRWDFGFFFCVIQYLVANLCLESAHSHGFTYTIIVQSWLVMPESIYILTTECTAIETLVRTRTTQVCVM